MYSVLLSPNNPPQYQGVVIGSNIGSSDPDPEVALLSSFPYLFRCRIPRHLHCHSPPFLYVSLLHIPSMYCKTTAASGPLTDVLL